MKKVILIIILILFISGYVSATTWNVSIQSGHPGLLDHYISSTATISYKSSEGAYYYRGSSLNLKVRKNGIIAQYNYIKEQISAWTPSRRTISTILDPKQVRLHQCNFFIPVFGLFVDFAEL
ncbi:MAG: hypothetical protein L3J12_08180 [Spirochaetales bacterium]|nr:hypothetical protein [Spirochaetales bacterium]